MKIHDGHRDRLKNKFRNHGAKTLEDHELIEMLLFFSIPRKNTNPLAHELLGRFGSVKELFESNAEDIEKIDGVGENSADLIMLVSELCRRYNSEALDSRALLNKYSALKGFLVNLFKAETDERAVIVLLNNSFRVLGVEFIGKGEETRNLFSMRDIVKYVLNYNAPYVVLAHNHIKAPAIPSEKDLYTTQQITSVLRQIDVKLVDHFIISGDRCNPIIHNASPDSEKEIDFAIEQIILTEKGRD